MRMRCSPLPGSRPTPAPPPGRWLKPPQPDWGLMLNTLRTALYTQPLLCALPGLMIFVTSISFNLMTDGLRSAMDIKA